jgi:hypothetical protein
MMFWYLFRDILYNKLTPNPSPKGEGEGELGREI